MLYQANGGIWFSLCIPGCDLNKPFMSFPARLASAEVGRTLAPVLAPTLTGLAAAWRTGLDGGSVVYAECLNPSGACVQASEWTNVPLFPAHGPAVAVAALGATRGMVFKALSPGMDGAAYAECAGNCTLAGSWWSVLTGASFPNAQGADLLLEDAGSGTLRHTAVWGGDSLLSPSDMLLRECTGPCNGPGSWANAPLEPGVFPQLVLDGSGLPRVFFLSSFPGGALRVGRCLQRPCSLPTNWSYSGLLPAVFGFSAGSSDAGTWFLASHNTNRLIVGVEAAGGYSTSDFGRCGPTSGDFPSADRYSPPDHAAYSRPNSMWIE
ncbi:MAG: hypothetical protein H6Q89_4043 [Myxococcaceae bacterium]|nr:hypothetical protein [Myxococcaceae bacterium]